jgi:chaperonin cofactor prefoldin
MIVAVDKKLACHKLESIEKKLNVVYYNQRVPLRPVITHLNGKERQLAKEQARLLRVRTFSIKEPILEAKELAERLGVLERAVKEILAEREFPGYKLVGDTLIKESNLEEIRERLDRRLDQGELNYEEATKIIEKAGVRNPTSVLDALSYSVTWRGIDPKSVRVYKKR